MPQQKQGFQTDIKAMPEVKRGERGASLNHKLQRCSSHSHNHGKSYHEDGIHPSGSALPVAITRLRIKKGKLER